MNDFETVRKLELAREVERLQERLAGALALYEGATKRAEEAEAEVERLTAILREGAEGNGLFKFACREALAKDQ